MQHDSESDSRDAPSRWTRWLPLLTSAGSLIVVVLAFVLPGIQDQLDRRSLRQAVDAYAAAGRALMAEGRYQAAEQVLARASELAEGKRVDLDRDRLRAAVGRLTEIPVWSAPNPEGLSEADILLLVQLERQAGDFDGEARAWTEYADFLAAARRLKDARQAAEKAVGLAPRSARALIALGNVEAELGRRAAADSAYRAAAAVDPADPAAPYDLGVLWHASDPARARQYFAEAIRLAPDDRDALQGLQESLRRLGDTAGADGLSRRLGAARPTPPTP